MNVLQIIGPPGTGKTQTLMTTLTEYLTHIPANEILFCSFTRAAVREATSRVRDQLGIQKYDLPYFGTIHSLCYRHLGMRPKDMLTLKKMQEFCKEHGLKLSDQREGTLDEPWEPAGSQDGDVFFAWYSWARNCLLDWETAAATYEPPDSVHWDRQRMIRLALEYERYKDVTGLRDFVQLLVDTLADEWAPSVQVLVLDEAQDCFSPETKVSMADGATKTIKEIVDNKITSEVLSYNEETRQVEPQPIIGWHKVPIGDKAMVSSGGLNATEDHPIYTRQNRYLDFQQCIDLNSEVLCLNHEKLQHERSTNSNGKINSNRVCTWRRLNKIEPRQGEDQCKAIICARDGTSNVPELEIRTTKKVGKDTPKWTLQNRIRWRNLSFCHNQSPCIYRNLYTALSSKRKKEKNYSKLTDFIRRTSICGLVHGRWNHSGKRQDLHICTLRIGCGCYNRVFNTKGDEMLAVSGEGQRPDSSIFSPGGTSFPSVDCSICSSRPWLQTTFKQTQQEKYSFGTYSRVLQYSGSHMQGLWRQIQIEQIASCLQFTHVQDHICQYDVTSMEKKPPAPQRRSIRRLHHLRQKICQGAGQAGAEDPKNLQPNLPDAFRKTEQEVYCIDVNKNHNFFANSILVHNCSPLQQKIILQWAEGKQAVIASDLDQGVYGFQGADPAWLMELPGETQFLEQSYRVPAKISAFAQRLIAKNVKRYDRGWAPTKEQGELVLDADLEELLPRMATGLETWFLLARNNAYLHKYAEAMQGYGIPYRNLRGGSPVVTAGSSVLAALRLATGAAITGRELGALVRDIPAGPWFARGAKEGIKRLVRERPNQEYQWNHLQDVGAHHELVRVLYNVDTCLGPLKLEQGVKDYFRKVYQRYGFKGFGSPWVTLSSIHGVKGQEADNVVLLPNVTRRTEDSYAADPEPERRVWYVGATRARKRLYVLAPTQGRFFEDW